MNPEIDFLIQQLKQVNIHLPVETAFKLQGFLEILLETNQHVNLTAIKDYHEAVIKHLFDSLVVVPTPTFQNAQSVLDIGSGAGIPGIPLAISCPDKHFTGIDSTRKKIDFQNMTCKQLQITNYQPIWGRAEELGHQSKLREQFDLVTARAVAGINILLEFTIPFIKPGGYAIYYKGPEYQDEIDFSQNAFKTLGVRLEQIHTLELPENQGVRSIVIFQKTKPTSSRYPRKPGIPQKKPL